MSGSAVMIATPSRTLFSVLLGLGLFLGCGASKPTQPPGAPPTPTTVTREDPGGDAHDPHLAALSRLLESNFGWRTDKDNQARFPLPDRRNWTRVRFLLIDHFVAFKYGEDQHAVTSGFVVKLPEDAPKTSAACTQQFELESMPKVAEFGGKVTDIESHMGTWKDMPLVVRRGTGHVKIFGKKYDAALSWAGYPAYDGACLVYAVAIPWDGSRAVAEELRDRWIDGFKKFRPYTTEPPVRQ